MKQKQVNYFTKFPQTSRNFEKGYKEIQKTKSEFVVLSLIPRKTNGDIDWINYLAWFEKENNFSETEAENYLKNKTNPVLYKYPYFKPTTETEAVDLLNKQMNYYVENCEYAWKIIFPWLTKRKPDLKYQNSRFVLIKEFTGGKEVFIVLPTRFIDPLPGS